MGLVRTTIQLSNPRDGSVKPVEVRALVDTGAMHLYVPEHVALQLRLESSSEREITTADGHKKLVPYVGPVEVQFNNRRCYVGALVLGDEVLLGAVPMEDMDLVISPFRQAVVVNPESPNIPSSVVKGFFSATAPCDVQEAQVPRETGTSEAAVALGGGSRRRSTSPIPGVVPPASMRSGETSDK